MRNPFAQLFDIRIRLSHDDTGADWTPDEYKEVLKDIPGGLRLFMDVQKHRYSSERDAEAVAKAMGLFLIRLRTKDDFPDSDDE